MGEERLKIKKILDDEYCVAIYDDGSIHWDGLDKYLYKQPEAMAKLMAAMKKISIK